MDTWEVEIGKFDADLEARMQLIRCFEVSGKDIELCIVAAIRKAQGFIRMGVFPYWLDSSNLWHKRNAERVAFMAKLRYHRNIEAVREYHREWERLPAQKKRSHDYYLSHKTEIKERVRLWKKERKKKSAYARIMPIVSS